MTDFTRLMAEIDEADKKLAAASAERRTREQQLDGAIHNEALAAVASAALHRALVLIKDEPVPVPVVALKRRGRKPKQNGPVADATGLITAPAPAEQPERPHFSIGR